ncbi:MAG: chorismate mutase [Chloroflexi bacterium]|nr:chorismate mutase [Chloroflexota bacterium]
MLRGIRGAITVSADSEQEIAAATREMLTQIVARNHTATSDIAAATFSLTSDLCAAFPAAAARALGWTQVPMLCHQELPVPDSLPRCIRVLVLWNTDKAQDQIQHVYLRDATRLRPDWAGRPQD